MRLEYFHLIDRVLELALAEGKIRTEAAVPQASPVFEGHFPGYPLMPGVLLVETMAQTTGWLAVALSKFERMAILAQIKDAKLRTAVRPGARLLVDGHLVHMGSGFAVLRAAVTSDGERACEAELTLRLIPFPVPELAEAMRTMAESIGLPTGTPANG